MSIIYCHKHDVTFDSDLEENCIDCIEEEIEKEHQNDQYEADKEEREVEYAESYQHPTEGNK